MQKIRSAVVFGILLGVTAQAAQAQCLAPDEWFGPDGTPGVPASFRVPSDDECHFYRWAWQTFLWSTQGPGGGDTSPRFIRFKTSNDLFQPRSGNSRQLVAAPLRHANEERMLTLAVRTSGSSNKGNVAAIAFEQAGSQGVVVDQNHRSLYYGIHLNARFVDFLHNDLHLTDPEMIKDISKTTEFPPGCLQLKSAWRVLSPDELKPENLGAIKARFFVTRALVPTLVAESGKIKADPSQPREEMVALLGLHVAGTIIDHPEFIWGTFEHVDNAPILANQALPQNQPVNDVRDFTLYRKGTLRMKSNKNPVFSTANPLTLIDAGKQTLDPIVDVFRQFDSGDGGVGEDEDVRDLNASVKSKLPDNLSVWRNYQMNGAVWLKSPSQSFKEDTEFDDDSVLAGEAKLSNSTMETFTQATTSKVNCFRCHNTKSESVGDKTLPGLRLKASHVIRNAYLPPVP